MLIVSDIADPEIKQLTRFYTESLKGSNAVVNSADYARLANCFIKICNIIDVTGKATLNKSNMDVVKKYGFASFNSLLDYLIGQINQAKIHGFRINNRRKFREKLNSFVVLNPPSSEALLSLVPKKYGKANNIIWTDEHQDLLKLSLEKHDGKLKSLAKALNSQFELRGLDPVSYETIKNKARRLMV